MWVTLMDKTDKIWFNGKFIDWDDAKIHLLVHALHYGTGVFEGMRCYNTKKGPAMFRPKEHFIRLHNSAKIYMMELKYTPDQLVDITKELIKINKLTECYIRPIAYYGYSKLGLNPRGNPIDIAIAVWKWGPYLGEDGIKNGVRCKVSSWLRTDSRSLPPLAKATANYANSVLAKLEALDCGYDEAIMLNYNGSVSEGPGENIFLIQDGCISTPPASAGALYGITQDTAVHILNDMGHDVERREIAREELFVANELFFTGTAAEITPIREVDGRIIGSGSRGPITKKVQDKFYDIVKGNDSKYSNWLVYV